MPLLALESRFPDKLMWGFILGARHFASTYLNRCDNPLFESSVQEFMATVWQSSAPTARSALRGLAATDRASASPRCRNEIVRIVQTAGALPLISRVIASRFRTVKIRLSRSIVWFRDNGRFKFEPKA